MFNAALVAVDAAVLVVLLLLVVVMMIVNSTSGWWDDPLESLEVHCDFKKWGAYPKKNHGAQLKRKKKKGLTIGFEAWLKTHK